MSKHKLTRGLTFIDGLKALGSILQYHVELEFPLKATLNTGSAIDVAWFKERGQKFPLFIFEVESAPTNAMGNNPLKVFSRSNDVFEKPLFYFQVVVSGGIDSSRIGDLQRQFGSHNYRIYRLAEADGQKQLLIDILSQHRRLTDRLDIVGVVDFLLKSKWIDVNIDDIVKSLDFLSYEKNGSFLPALGILTTRYPDLVNLYCEMLLRQYGASIDYPHRLNYNSYFGHQWFLPIHLGIKALFSESILEKGYCFEKVKTWNENSDHLTMIGPHFGLNQDYDNFLIFGAGGFFAVLSTLFHEVQTARTYFAEQLELIIDRSKDQFKVINLMWLMHIAPKNGQGKKFIDKSTSFFTAQSFFSSEAFYFMSLISSEELVHEITHKRDEMPNFEPSSEYFIRPEFDNNFVIRNAIRVLVDSDVSVKQDGTPTIDILRTLRS